MNKICSMLGLAQKAGKLVSGNNSCEAIIKSGKCSCVILSKDASDKTKRKFRDMCSFRNLKVIEYGNKEEIGRCIGKSARSVLVLKDSNFAKKVEELIKT